MVAPGITVNGHSASLEGVPTHTTALDWLRDRGLTGCKEGCAEGECGACSVLVARPALDAADATEWVAINACLVPIAAFDGQELVTAEGLGRPDALHPVQREMAMRGGSQCGYCTPGFICSMAAEYYRADRRPQSHANGEHGPNGFDIHALSGNLCRCTGYRPIRDAAYALDAPSADDPFAVRRGQPAPGPSATVLQRDGRGGSAAAGGPRRHRGRGMHRLGGRSESPRRPRIDGGRGRPVGRTARTAGRPGCSRDRCRPYPHRDRATAGRPGAAARGSIPSVRLSSHPQRRDDRRKHRNRLAHR